ncbi:response regulator transcription factor [Planomonospora parontospora]|uniref:response regulator transcription factor n=1 Tax=Planomonospora parontospora TaxID=58119 RepID=UPI00167122F4|nr:response regulator transcription factor [Planomonospora parontospora]GGL36434.1 DNA-binding response regulator [Planomonospora parontospora subsp. antibiotica]GII17366.1 DNA-binding response regulator [Planomonospora parontospora subsp. antibiotica]
MITILVADDHAVVRTGFRMILGFQPDMSVVGEAADGAQAVRLSRELRPEVVLMDVHMPGTDGVAATREITEALPGTRVLGLSTFDLDEYVVAMLRAGAAGFLPKDVSPEELVEGVRTVHRGEAAVAPRLLTRLIGTFVRAPRPRPAPATGALASLTDREREVLVLIAGGYANGEIAERLAVSPSTVKNHVTSLFAKIGARDRAQAVIAAYEAGLVAPGR